MRATSTESAGLARPRARSTGSGDSAGSGASGGWAPLALPAVMVATATVSVQAGAGIATKLFGELPPASLTALRLLTAALIMLIVGGRGAARAVTGLVERRAWPDLALTVAFGIVLGFMNFSIYQAFARIPLGVAVTIEFLGPLLVSVTGVVATGESAARRASGLIWAALAAVGVVCLARGAVGHLNPAGVAWSVAAAAAWAGYIIGSKTAGQRLPGSAALVIAMCVAALAVSGPGVAAGGARMFRPRFLAAGAGIGLLSSVIPYWMDLETLRRVPARLYSVWQSVQPAVAALIGLVIVGQRLSLAEWAGIACVVAASAGAARTAVVPANTVVPANSSAIAIEGDR